MRIYASASDSLSVGRIWVPSIMADQFSEAGIVIEGAAGQCAGRVAFGTLRLRGVPVGLSMKGTGELPCSVQYTSLLGGDGTMFAISNGGRLYTESFDVLDSKTTVLEISSSGSSSADSYCHLNGMKMDGNFRLNQMAMLRNTDSNDATNHVRFTNAVVSGRFNDGLLGFIDRTGGNGQTFLDLEGVRRAYTADISRIRLEIYGASQSKKSYFLVTQSDTPSGQALVDQFDTLPLPPPPVSTNYEYAGRNNWTFADGSVPDDAN